MTILLRNAEKIDVHGSKSELYKIMDEIMAVQNDTTTDWFDLPEIYIDTSEIVTIFKPVEE